jgi:PleD family two-component response regulator
VEKTKILLFTRDKWTAEIFQEALDDTFIIYATGNSEKVVEAAIENKIDLFFIDMEMTGVDGFKICEYLNDIVETSHITKVMIVIAMDLNLFERAKRSA